MPNVVLCGLDEAGKTSIKVFLENMDKSEAMKPYIASNSIETYRKHYLSIYVVPGQAQFRNIEFFYEQYFPLADRVGYVVDAGDPARFPEARQYWGYLKRMIKKHARKDVEVIFVAHKQDKETARRAEDIVYNIFSKDDIKKYRVKMISTSVLDVFSMYELLRTFYGDVKKVGIDVIVDVLRANTNARAAFIIDSHMLPISVVGDKDSLKFMEEVFYPIYKRGALEYMAVKFENIRFLAIARRVDGDFVVAGIYDYKIQMGEAIDYCKKALSKYVDEARKRWGKL